MSQTSGIFAIDARSGCTLGFAHAYWHISQISGGHKFLATWYLWSKTSLTLRVLIKETSVVYIALSLPPRFAVTRYLWSTNISACSPGAWLHVDMHIIAIQQYSKEVTTTWSLDMFSFSCKSISIQLAVKKSVLSNLQQCTQEPSPDTIMCIHYATPYKHPTVT